MPVTRSTAGTPTTTPAATATALTLPWSSLTRLRQRTKTPTPTAIQTRPVGRPLIRSSSKRLSPPSRITLTQVRNGETRQRHAACGHHQIAMPKARCPRALRLRMDMDCPGTTVPESPARTGERVSIPTSWDLLPIVIYRLPIPAFAICSTAGHRALIGTRPWLLMFDRAGAEVEADDSASRVRPVGHGRPRRYVGWALRGIEPGHLTNPRGDRDHRLSLPTRG